MHKAIKEAVLNVSLAHLLAHNMNHQTQWVDPVTAAVGFNSESFPKEKGAYDFSDPKHMAKHIGKGYQKWVEKFHQRDVSEVGSEEKFFNNPLQPRPYLLVTLDRECKWIAVTQVEPTKKDNCFCPVVSFHEVETKDPRGNTVDLSFHILLATIRHHIAGIADKKKFHGQQDLLSEAMAKLDWSVGIFKKLGKSVSLMPKSDFLASALDGTEILLSEDL